METVGRRKEIEMIGSIEMDRTVYGARIVNGDGVGTAQTCQSRSEQKSCGNFFIGHSSRQYASSVPTTVRRGARDHKPLICKEFGTILFSSACFGRRIVCT